MGKYNRFARDLDAAFKAARSEYTDAVEKLHSAEQARNTAGGDALTRKRRELEYLEAEKEFRATSDRIWDQFAQTRQQLKNDLEAEIRVDSTANPDAVDANAIELLKSGIMSTDDFVAMAEKFSGNTTMIRILSKYAKDAADNLSGYDRVAINQLVSQCEVMKNGTMRAWNDISNVSVYCSGQAHGNRENPSYILAMCERWEQLAGEAIQNF